MGWKFLLPFIRGKKHLLSFFKEIWYRCAFGPFNDIVLLTSASIEERFLSFHTHFSNEAEVGTPFTFERSLFITALTQVKPFKTRSFPCPLFHGQDGDTDGPCHIMILRNNDLFIQNLLKSSDHAFIESRPTLKEDSIPDTAVPDHPIKIVLND